ncbi:transmembrane protein 231 [Plodia interpunctella]|uniref:transmembrane protein 231 n=1 Tax=Plodia interpunctella TaxID=58824 RepID=UPI002367A852|nr:transmembrane protein 231 [Plodia interpunctella]
MVLYKLFSHNVEIQYKSCLLSKAMLFTIFTTLLNIILPFIIAYRSRGFWLKSHNYYEQPAVRFQYEYILIAETEDPSQPIVCGEASILNGYGLPGDENCAQIQVQERDYNEDGKNDFLNIDFTLNVPQQRTVVSFIGIIGIDFQLHNVCPLHMQSLVIISEEFAVPPKGLTYFGDMEFYQVTHLTCLRNVIDTTYNISLLSYSKDSNENIVDFILGNYYRRAVITQSKRLYSHGQNGHTGTMKIDVNLRIPEMLVVYKPSLLQELKWAWPQYLSLIVIFYWIFEKIKRFVFHNRLLMAWVIIPWRSSYTETVT